MVKILKAYPHTSPSSRTVTQFFSLMSVYSLMASLPEEKPHCSLSNSSSLLFCPRLSITIIHVFCIYRNSWGRKLQDQLMLIHAWDAKSFQWLLKPIQPLTPSLPWCHGWHHPHPITHLGEFQQTQLLKGRVNLNDSTPRGHRLIVTASTNH